MIRGTIFNISILKYHFAVINIDFWRYTSLIPLFLIHFHQTRTPQSYYMSTTNKAPRLECLAFGSTDILPVLKCGARASCPLR